MASQPQIRLATIDGEILRDEGMALAQSAASPAWWFAMLCFIAALPEGWTGLAEDIRLAAMAAGVPSPSGRGQFGSLIGAVVKQGVLIEKDPLELRKPIDAPSHASKKVVWRRTGLV